MDCRSIKMRTRSISIVCSLLLVGTITALMGTPAKAQSVRKKFDELLETGLKTIAKGSAKDVAGTNAWLKTTNSTVFKYRFQTKYKKGNGRINVENKWEEIDIKKQPDPVLRYYFAERKRYEEFLDAEGKKRRRVAFWFFARTIAEGLGGDDARDFFDSVEETRKTLESLKSVSKVFKEAAEKIPEKQDALSVFLTLNKSGVTIRTKAWCMSRLRIAVRANIKSRYGADAAEILTLFDAPANLKTVSREEIIWLKANLPVLYDEIIVKSSRRVASAKEQLVLAQKMAKAFMATYESVLAKSYGKDNYRLRWYSRQARICEKEELPLLAAPLYEKWLAAFWPAFREAMTDRANRLTDHPLEVMRALRLSTISEFVNRRTFGRSEKSRFVVSLTNSTVLEKQAKIGAKLLGFLGQIKSFETIRQVELASSGKRLVVLAQTGLAIYDMETGKQIHRIFDASEKNKMMSMAVSLTDRYVYVVDDSPNLRRYDVTTGKRDAKF
jgi:hypothetical protein